MGKSSQAKGRHAELELVKVLQSYGIPAEPGQAVSYGATPDVVGVAGIHCECKRAEQLRLSEWMSQSERDAKRFGDGVPALFFRRSREPWRVVMNLSDWVQIYTKAQSCKCGGRCQKGGASNGAE